MKKKRLIICAICLISLFLIVASSFTLTTFSDNLATSNLTFTTNENITLNLTISRFADAISAYINLTGQIGSIFYAETNSQANIVYQHPSAGYIIGIDNSNDNDWTTYASHVASPSGKSSLFQNFTTNSSVAKATVTYKFGISSGSAKFYDQSCYNYSSNSYAYMHGSNCTQIYNFTNVDPTSYCSDLNFNNADHTINNLTVPSDCVKSGSPTSFLFEVYYEGGAGGAAKVFYESTFYQVYYPQNLSLSIGTYDGSYEWNFTGEFNQTHSPNKTQDLSISIDSAINSGLCNCTGCFLDSSNCSVPFLFHSDTAGQLQYDAILIDYLTRPKVTLSMPSNNSYKADYVEFECNVTDDINITNATLKVYNSTNILVSNQTSLIIGLTNSSRFNVTFAYSDTFKWNCLAYNNNSYKNAEYFNYTLSIDTDLPVVVLQTPQNNSWLSYSQNITFNYTATKSNGLKNCSIYTNTTGAWHLNSSNSSGLINGSINSFWLNVSDGGYIWDVRCYDNSGNNAFSKQGNFSFFVDTVYPLIEISAPGNSSTTEGTSISMTYSISDSNIDACSYNLWTGTSWVYAANVTLSCIGTSVSIATPSYAEYVIQFWAVDKASNTNSTSKTVITRAPSGPVGGGGGAPPETGPKVCAIGDLLWAVQTEEGASEYNLLITEKGKRTRSLVFYNQGSKTIDIELKCAAGTDFPDICDYVTIENNKLILSPTKEEIKVPFIIDFTNANYSSGSKIFFSIIVTDSEKCQFSFPVSIEVSPYGIFFRGLDVFSGLGGTVKGTVIPIWAAMMTIFLLSFILFTFIFRKRLILLNMLISIGFTVIALSFF